MVTRVKLLSSAFLWSALALIPASAPGQDATAAPPHVAAVDGTATLERDGAPDAAVTNMPFVPGDRLRTTAGRVEIAFPDGAVLDVDQYTEIALETDHGVSLTEGRALLRIPRVGSTTAFRYELVTPATSITASGPGEYRLSYPDEFDSARVDDFERWLDNRRGNMAPAVSAEYLPPDLQVYGATFDQYGVWEREASYGYVWYPAVAATWRPYFNGYWASIPSYGWTWIGADLWSWPTHHYGRWGYTRRGWFWIPARSWAPAWVAWGAADSLVSWCPLGWNSRPVFILSVGTYDPWRGWTVVPRSAFGHTRVSVPRNAIAPRHLSSVSSAAFIVRSRPPIATPRSIVSTAAGSSQHAVPRATAGSRTGMTPGTVLRDSPATERRADRDAVSPGDDAASRRSASTHDRFYTRPQPSLNTTPAAEIERPSAVLRHPSGVTVQPAPGKSAGPAYRAPAIRAPISPSRVPSPTSRQPDAPVYQVPPYGVPGRAVVTPPSQTQQPASVAVPRVHDRMAPPPSAPAQPDAPSRYVIPREPGAHQAAPAAPSALQPPTATATPQRQAPRAGDEAQPRQQAQPRGGGRPQGGSGRRPR